MYAAHFGLRQPPFENVPDPAFFFNEGGFRRVLARLADAMAAGRGLMVVAGPIGSGKTTLSQKLMAELPAGTVHVWCAEPPETDRELFGILLGRLGADDAGASRVQALTALRERLLQERAAGRRCLLVVDEAHKFGDAGLEAVRLLNNLEQGADKLVQVLLLGQDELTTMLARPGREAFRQRVANLEQLGRMTPPQVRDYVRHRIRVAGGDPAIFPEPMLDAVAEAADGIPRLTNTLCDRALLHAFEQGRAAVDRRGLLHAAEEVGVHRKAFHVLVGQARGADAAPAAQAPPAPAAGPAAAPRAAGFAPAAAAREAASGRGLALPLALLAGGVVALVASLVWFASRAAAPGGDWLGLLLDNLVR